MSDVERLESLLRSGNSCVWCVTDDEEHALRLAREAAMALGWPIRQWDAVHGIVDSLIQPGGGAEEGTEHPAAALYRFGEYGEPTLCIALDLFAHLSDERTLRAARSLVARFDREQEERHLSGKLMLIDHRENMPAVLRACAARFDVSYPDADEIERIIASVLRRLHRRRPIEATLPRRDLLAIVNNLRGLSRRQVEQAIVAAVVDDRRFSAEDLPGILAHKRRLIESEGLLEFVEAPTGMDQIGGLAKLKQWLKQREDSLSDEAREFGLKAPRGVLMLGVQGAGKSLCAKAIATAWKRPLLRLDPGVLYDRYIGESERRLRDALRQAELMAPVVLWIDEIEKAFASAASRSIDGGLSQRMFGTLLTWLQEHREPVFVAATANDIEALPPELLRKGRFDEIFFVDLPGAAARRQIFQIHLKKRGRDPKSFDLAALTAAAEGYSGAEIEQAVVGGMHAAYASRTQVTTGLILDAIKGSPPLSVTMAERIGELRAWASGRCMPAE